MTDTRLAKSVYLGEKPITRIYLGSKPIGGVHVPMYNRRLAYLQATGTQWIDTGVACLMGTTAEYSVEVDTDSPLSGGSYELTGRGTGWYFGVVGTGGTGKAWTNFTGTTGTMTTPVVAPNTAYTVVQTWESGVANTSVSDGETTGAISRTATAVPNEQFRLFGLYVSSGNSYPCKCLRVKRAKYTQSGVLIRDFVPVLDLNLVPCMHDRVSGELFANKGTGTFAYGELDGEAVAATYTSEEISAMAALLPATLSLRGDNSTPRTDEEIVRAYVELQQALSEGADA